MVNLDLENECRIQRKIENKKKRIQREDSPVPVAPELFVEIGAMTVVVSK